MPHYFPVVQNIAILLSDGEGETGGTETDEGAEGEGDGIVEGIE